MKKGKLLEEKLKGLYDSGYMAGLKRALGVARAAQYSKTPATDTMRGIEKLIGDSPSPPPVV